jgi:ribonucleotide monophosphatase NagD (HAD superfamily)
MGGTFLVMVLLYERYVMIDLTSGTNKHEFLIYLFRFVQIEFASQRRAINVGKPSKTLLELLISSQQNFDVTKTLMVGDRLDTDVRFGIEHGMKSALVLTGVTDVHELRRIRMGTVEEPLPSVILSHVGLMAKQL